MMVKENNLLIKVKLKLLQQINKKEEERLLGRILYNETNPELYKLVLKVLIPVYTLSYWKEDKEPF